MSAEEELKAFVAGIDGFGNWSHADKIRMFAWLQHFLRNKNRFSTSDINWCYNTLSFKSTNTSQYLTGMEGKELLRDNRGYHCEGKFLAKYNERYATHDITLSVRQMVRDLVNLMPELGEKDIFQEAIKCLKHDAGRATIIMVWNIAFYHLCQFVLKHHLSDFNNRIPIRYSRKWRAADMPLINKYDDFGDEMSEREVIEVCSSAGIINGAMHKVYLAKLDERNSAAHPSTNHVTQVQAEGFIDNLIRNTVLLLKI